MTEKLYLYKNAHVLFYKANGSYHVKLRIGSQLADKVVADSYRAACEYRRAFCAIAKNAR